MSKVFALVSTQERKGNSVMPVDTTVVAAWRTTAERNLEVHRSTAAELREQGGADDDAMAHELAIARADASAKAFQWIVDQLSQYRESEPRPFDAEMTSHGSVSSDGCSCVRDRYQELQNAWTQVADYVNSWGWDDLDTRRARRDLSAAFDALRTELHDHGARI